MLQNGCSPVCAASEKGHTEVVDLLVSAGADIHKATTTVSTLPISAVYDQYTGVTEWQCSPGGGC